MKENNMKRCFSILLVIAFIFTMLPSTLLHSYAANADMNGSGTADDPFTISSKADLARMRDHVNNKDTYNDGSEYSKAYYVLTADIDLECADGSSWYPIGRYGSGISDGVAFEGVFDGNGYTISGLYIDGNDKSLDSYDDFSHSTKRVYYFGLFGENKGTIKRLTVDDATIKNLGMYNGIIAGISSGTIENCSTGGSVTGSFSNGGIVGACEGSGTVKNCISTATSTTTSFGAICGNWTVATASMINNYYPATTKVSNGADIEGKMQAMSDEDIGSGKVAWLLQNGQDTLIWEQKIGSDGYPVLHNGKDGDSGDKVYRVSFMLGGNEVGEDYQNYGGKTKAPKVEADIEGYTSGDRWYKDSGLSSEWSFGSDTITADTMIYSERTPIEYTITLLTDGGSVSEADWANGSKEYTIESADFTLPTPSKEGYDFIGWISDGEDIVGAAQREVTIKKGSRGDRTYTAVYKDSKAPDVTIKIGEHEWHAINKTPAFDLFYNTSQTVEIAASDNEEGELTIQYYVSNREIEEADLENVKWNNYNVPFTIAPERKVIVYAKVTDDDGNISYISTTGIVLEVTAPVIKGVTENSTSCEAAQFTVTDENLLTVTVDNNAIEAVGGKYTVSDIGKHTITATDKAGNISTVSFEITEHKKGLSIKMTSVQPSCEETGVLTVKTYCDNCGTLYSTDTETIKALGHDWGEWQTLVMPDCDDTGTRQHICKRCNKTETEGLEAQGHSWESDYTIDKEATCTEPGSKSIHCTKCPVVKDSTEIPVMPHTPGETSIDGVIEANCTEDGSYFEIANCTECGAETLRVLRTMPAKGHDFTDWEEVEANGCDNEGHLKRVCNTCGLIETQNVAASGHTWDDHYTIDQAPTCTNVGSQSKHCSVCGATKDSEVIPSTGHTESDPVKENVTAPDCTTSGIYDEVIYCATCGDEISRKAIAIPATGHSPKTNEESVKAATCIGDGYTGDIVCEVCKETLAEGEKIPATGEHTPVIKGKKDATCTEEGYTGDTVCEVCKEVIEAGKTVSALGHSYKDGVCTVCGAKDNTSKDDSSHKDTDDSSPNTGSTIPYATALIVCIVIGCVVISTKEKSRRR